ncbi:hypothetical protein COU91_02255 [Candidatus Saccharibacteria bacterium CG10_big_fil_rev_8_21_14_0_10_47_8]|nr:MAG: hypothetical protein COU91_02255 [Candidatus Saccharibacteria bacterium CG10_big_fil_rev_8_21_14_0_10_47_8]
MRSAESSLESQLASLTARFVMLLQQKPYEAVDEHLTLLSYRAAFLMYFNKTSKMTMKEIAANLQVTMPSATLLIERLVERKYALREQDENDRRQVRVYLSSSGESLVANKLKIERRRFEEILHMLTDDEKKAVLKFFDIAFDKLTSKVSARNKSV